MYLQEKITWKQFDALTFWKVLSMRPIKSILRLEDQPWKEFFSFIPIKSHRNFAETASL